MKKTALLLMVITVFSKVLGFVREIILSYFYGVSSISDAYLVSLTIPGVIFTFVGIGISSGYIPIYSKIAHQSGEEEGHNFTNKLISILLIVCTLIVFISLLFTEQIVKVFASGFEGETLRIAIQFTKMGILGIYFTGLVYVFSGFLQIKGSYAIPALIGFPLNIFIISSIFLSTRTNIMVLAIGSLIATAAQLIFLIPFMYKKGFKYKFILDIKDKHIINMMYIALPIIIGTSVNQINILIDKTLASQIAVGGISALNYANKLNLFIQGIFVMPIATVLFPKISQMAVAKNTTGFKESISEAITSINLLVLPAALGAMLFAKEIVKLLFGRGAFDAYAITMTSNSLFFFSIGMIGFGLNEILLRGFYSMQDTRTPTVNAVASMIINITLNLILSRFLGIGGLALGTSISAIVCTSLLFISLRKKIGSFGMKKVALSFFKILVASVVMGAIAKISFSYFTPFIPVSLSLISSIFIGGIIYLAVIYFMRIEDVDVIVNTLKEKLKRTN